MNRMLLPGRPILFETHRSIDQGICDCQGRPQKSARDSPLHTIQSFESSYRALDKQGNLRIAGPTVSVSLAQARAILGPDCLDLEEVSGGLDVSLDSAPADLRDASGEIPFSSAELESARRRGQILVFRLQRDAEEALTILRFIERFPAAFEPGLLSKVGYSLRDEWGITLEPLAKSETCEPGWHLVHKAPLPATYNLSYYEQETVLARDKDTAGSRRRTAVEATFDLVVYQLCRGQRLLDTVFDWTSSRTVDGGFLYVGGFSDSGLSVVGFSAAVRHAGLGVCPNRAGA